MTSIRVNVRGTDEFIKAMRRAGGELDSDRAGNAADIALNKAAEHVRTQAVKAISKGDRSGRTYKRGKSILHKASAPGEFPKTDTGELVSNITVEKIPGGYDVGSRAQAPQGFYLETKAASDGGRPWLRPTLESNQTAIERIINRAIKKAF